MGGFSLGKIFGIPIQARFSFLLLLGLFLIWHGLGGVVLLLALFASVLLHELGHALVARRLKVPILGIDLHFFGGAAKLSRMPEKPSHEIAIAVAGPAVSFLLALGAFLVFRATGYRPIAQLAAINLVLGAFNLLPALPMDGGRILRALLARKLGRLRATEIAVKVARISAVGLGVLGLWVGNFFLVALAVMLWVMAGVELRAAQLWSYARQMGFATEGASEGEVEVLDRDLRPVGRDGEDPFPRGPAGLGLRGFGFRRVVVRGPDGRVFVQEDPIRW
jgi:stage IV sporulation protein FB